MPRPFEYVVYVGSKFRRLQILQHLTKTHLVVNRKYTLNTQRDPDLKRLLKLDYIVQKRIRCGFHSFYTEIHITKNGREYLKKNS